MNCCRCKIILNELNSTKYLQKQSICRVCECNRERNWRIRRSLTTVINGQRTQLTGNKRPFPQDNSCELCNNLFTKNQYAYHHWDDKDISRGIWVCGKCHILEDSFERATTYKDLINKYLELRNGIHIS